MQIESLDVQRRPAYDSEYPNMLVGMVKVKGSMGTQEIRLSNESLAAIFAAIKEDVVSTAKKNAAEVTRAMTDAGAEALVLNNSKVEQLS
jgi:hypothetical protein